MCRGKQREESLQQIVLPHSREKIEWEQPYIKDDHNHEKNDNEKINNNEEADNNNYKEDNNKEATNYFSTAKHHLR